MPAIYMLVAGVMGLPGGWMRSEMEVVTVLQQRCEDIRWGIKECHINLWLQK